MHAEFRSAAERVGYGILGCRAEGYGSASLAADTGTLHMQRQSGQQRGRWLVADADGAGLPTKPCRCAAFM